MQPEIIALIAALLVIAVIVTVLLWRKRRSQALRERFGPEYEHTLEETGDRREAERELRERQERRKQLDIRPLPTEARERHLAEWQDAQRRFVDTPEVAVRDAHVLITQVMRDRGYPMEDFERRAADVSVDHPEVVEDYRAANRIATDNERGQASTEDLRQAMVHLRSLFDRLLETSTDADTEVR
jgi:hypothetical protein